MLPTEIAEAQEKVTRYGSHFDEGCDRYLPLLEPMKTKAGKIAKRQPTVQRQTKRYWQAQCSFRSLTTNGSVEELQQRLRARDKTRDAQISLEQAGLWRPIREAQAQLAREEAQKRQNAEDEKWQSASVHQKADINAGRLLRETFNSAANSALVIKTNNRAQIHQLCDSMGLEHHSTDAPHGPKQGYPDRWIIVGVDRDAVWKAASDVRAEAAEENARQSTTRKSEIVEKHAEILRAVEESGDESWDIKGTYAIECPDLSGYFGRPRELTMTIYSDMAKSGLTGNLLPWDPDNEDDQEEELDLEEPPLTSERPFFAVFDFNMIEGIMRIYCPEPTETGIDTSWKFIWRGRDSSENMIQVGSDRIEQDISFGDGGTTLSGTFSGSFVGEVSFTGVKIAPRKGMGVSSSAAKWDALSRNAYEAEETGRWR